MSDDALWDIVYDTSPFGSDEGNTAYHEFIRWRESYPSANLIDCFHWMLEGKLDQYTDELLEDNAIAKVATGDEKAGLIGLNFGTVFTLDATIIATALAQLATEGRIDPEAKPYALVAVPRQLHPTILAGWREHAEERRRLMEASKDAIEAA
jgi:uncharacterized protein YfeS